MSALAAAVVLGACAAGPAERAAERGDLAALHDAIAARQRAGALTNADAASIARAVAEREVREAAGPEAPARIRAARACTRELEEALAWRMRTHDEAGADAALALLEGGRLDGARARSFAADPEAPWRAVGARGLLRGEDREARLRAFVAAEPAVRREAVRAAHIAADPRDEGPLFEVARLDPEPLVQTEAVRALGALPPAPDRVRAERLADLWRSSSDEALRGDVAVAWAQPGLWAQGGRDALYRVIATGSGGGTVEAAAAVLRRRDADPEVADAAAARLLGTIANGSRGARLQALAVSPLQRADLRAAVEEAARDPDPEVRVGALARLAEGGAPPYVEALESLARPGSFMASRARFALAAAGDRRVQAWVEEDLAAPRPFARLSAANELAALGVAARAAGLLADSDGAVRLRAACTILMASRRR